MQNYLLIKHFLNKGLGFESLVLAGPSGTGKTLFCKALVQALRELYIKMEEAFDFLFISDMDRLKLYNKERIKFLLFDDVNLSKVVREQKIHLLCANEEETDIRLRNINATLGSYLPRVFTTNNILNILSGVKELLRRVYVVFVDKEFNFKDYDPDKYYYLSEDDIYVFPAELNFKLKIDRFCFFKTIITGFIHSFSTLL